MGKSFNLGKIKGADGKSAYAAACEGGFVGTESEFNALLSSGGVDDSKLIPTIDKIGTKYFEDNFSSTVENYVDTQSEIVQLNSFTAPINSLYMKSSNGNVYEITIDKDGNFVSSEVTM